MLDIVGFSSIFIVILVTYYFSQKWKQISQILLTGLCLRLIVLLLGHFILTLPDSTADAESLESYASRIANDGFYNLLDHFKGPAPRFISWMIAIPYSIFGRSILMAQSISLLFGIGCIVLGWKISLYLWGEVIAKKVGWLIALFPSLILYSVLTLREVYSTFFILVALYGIVKWSRKDNLKSIIIVFIGFGCSIFFHGAVVIGAFIFILIFGFESLKKFIYSLNKNILNIKYTIFVLIFSIITILYLSNKISVPYLNDYSYITDSRVILEKTKLSTMGNASYPKWLIANSINELFYKIPIRSFYFLFSPFPWDIKEFKHLIGFFDSILYIYLTSLIVYNLKFILKDKALRIIFLILLTYLIVFGVGVGNFGSGIRHRSKFVIMFILLAAPLIKKIVFKKPT